MGVDLGEKQGSFKSAGLVLAKVGLDLGKHWNLHGVGYLYVILRSACKKNLLGGVLVLVCVSHLNYIAYLISQEKWVESQITEVLWVSLVWSQTRWICIIDSPRPSHQPWQVKLVGEGHEARSQGPLNLTTLNSHINVGGMGHTNFLVKVEWTWVQDPRSSPKLSQRCLTATLNIIHKTKASHNKIITHINYLKKQSMWPTSNFYYNFSLG